MTHMRYLAALSALSFCLAAPAIAQTAAPAYIQGDQVKAADGIFVIDKSGTPFGTSTNPIYISCAAAACSGGGAGGTSGAVAQSGSWANSIINGSNTLAISPSGQAFVYDANTATLAGAINTPIPAQTSGAIVWIGSINGKTTAGTADPDPVTVQGNASGVPVPTTVSGTVATLAALGTTNGWTPLLANALGTTVKAVKSSAGQIGTLQCYNPNSSQVYVQVFNLASGSVTLGTTTPALSIPIAPLSTGGLALASPGINFSTAISIAVTTTATGSTAASTATDCNVAYN